MLTNKIFSILIGTGLLLGLSAPAYAGRMCSADSECAEEGAACVTPKVAAGVCVATAATVENRTPDCICLAAIADPPPDPIVPEGEPLSLPSPSDAGIITTGGGATSEDGTDEGGTHGGGADVGSYAAESYAAEYGVSVEEALRRFHLQEVAGDVDMELAIQGPDAFAGLWLEHSPEFKVVVQFTPGNADTFRPYLQTTELATEDLLDVREEAEVSLAKLKKTQQDLLWDLKEQGLEEPGLEFESGINVPSNQVDVLVLSRSYFLTQLRKAGIQLPEWVDVIEVPALSEYAAGIHAGLSLGACTSGFAVEAVKDTKETKEGTKGILTAGHCPNSLTYQRKEVPMKKELEMGSYDVQWHATPGFVVEARLESDSGAPFVTEVVKAAKLPAKGRVCKYGQMTKSTCGVISHINYMPKDPKDAEPTYIRVGKDEKDKLAVDKLAAKGDSGGPVFLAEGFETVDKELRQKVKAYGILTHCVPIGVRNPKDPETCGKVNDFVFMPVDFVEDGRLGVRILTK